MKLKEHLVARKVVKDEINRMIEDFQSKDPTLRDKEWSSNGKNYSFKQDVFNKTGIELTDKYIKHNIISEIAPYGVNIKRFTCYNGEKWLEFWLTCCN